MREEGFSIDFKREYLLKMTESTHGKYIFMQHFTPSLRWKQDIVVPCKCKLTASSRRNLGLESAH